MNPLFERPELGAHFVQLYESDTAALVNNVGSYFCGTLRAGGAAVIVAGDPNRSTFVTELRRRGCDVDLALTENRLVLLDAHETLNRISRDGQIDPERFEQVVGATVRRALETAKGREVRAYGEMVGLLWKSSQFPAAIRLEQLWNQLQSEVRFSLFCSYAIDIFGRHFDGGVINAMLCAHSHLLPTVTDDHLEYALDRALSESLDFDSAALKALVTRNSPDGWGQLPKAEATILWLRRNHPRNADKILERAKSHYQSALRRTALEIA